MSASGTPAEELVIQTVKKECPGMCPYRWGDGDQHAEKLKNELRSKLRFRVAWGHELRVLEKKYQKLRNGIEIVMQGNIGSQERAILQKLLDDTQHDPVAERYEPSR